MTTEASGTVDGICGGAEAAAKGDEEAVKAEARRKAVVDEARKGADADVRTRQYIAKYVADETLATEQAARAKDVDLRTRTKAQYRADYEAAHGALA